MKTHKWRVLIGKVFVCFSRKILLSRFFERESWNIKKKLRDTRHRNSKNRFSRNFLFGVWIKRKLLENGYINNMYKQISREEKRKSDKKKKVLERFGDRPTNGKERVWNTRCGLRWILKSVVIMWDQMTWLPYLPHYYSGPTLWVDEWLRKREKSACRCKSDYPILWIIFGSDLAG